MKVEIYQAEDGFRWRMIATNGNIVADSAEAYTRAYDCKSAATKLVARIKIEGVDFTESRKRSRL